MLMLVLLLLPGIIIKKATVGILSAKKQKFENELLPWLIHFPR